MPLVNVNDSSHIFFHFPISRRNLPILMMKCYVTESGELTDCVKKLLRMRQSYIHKFMHTRRSFYGGRIHIRIDNLLDFLTNSKHNRIALQPATFMLYTSPALPEIQRFATHLLLPWLWIKRLLNQRVIDVTVHNANQGSGAGIKPIGRRSIALS